MTKNPNAGTAAVDAYVAKVPERMRALLAELRTTIKSAAPKAEEVISYGMPAFRQERVLVYYAAFRDHCSFFPGSASVRRAFAKELTPFSGGKGTVRITPEHPLPAALVKRIVKARVAEDEARSKAGRPRARRAKGSR